MSDERKKLFEQWYEARDRLQLRHKYPLNQDSIIFDVGSYVGDWALEMYERYKCKIWCFEPVTYNFKILQARVGKIPSFWLFNFAIGLNNGRADIGIGRDASGFFHKSKNKETVEVRSLSSFLKKAGIDKVDFLKINIEGAEYAVFDDLIKHNKLKDLKHIQVQFHEGLPQYKEKRLAIQKELAKTHEKDYDYEFIWESWSRI